MLERRDSLLVAPPRRRLSWDRNYGQRRAPPPPAPCTWAEEGGRPGACGLSGQTGRDVLAKPRGWRRPRPAYGGREGEQQLVKTGMKERDSGPAAASVPPPDSSPAKSSSYAPA